MGTSTVVDRFARALVATCVLVLGPVVAVRADDRPSLHGATIGIFADRYVVTQRAFDDLDRLEQHITATAAGRNIDLVVCDSQATRSLKAVVHRLRHAPLHIVVPDASEPSCSVRRPLATRVRKRAGQRPFGIDDEAVDRYWLDLVP
jgi:hypothetical protein